jgi:hypothetical protein
MAFLRALFALGFLLASSNAASASFTATWDMTGAGNQATKPGSTTAGNVTASVLSEGSVSGSATPVPDSSPIGTQGPYTTGLINSNSWTNTQTPNEYYTITLTATSGVLNLGTLTFWDAISINKNGNGQGPQKGTIQISTNGGAFLYTDGTTTPNQLWTPDQTGAVQMESINLSAFTNLTTVTIRIMGYKSTANGAASQYALVGPQSGQAFTDPSLTFDTNVVPVPASAVLALTGLPIFLVARRKRRAVAA